MKKLILVLVLSLFAVNSARAVTITEQQNTDTVVITLTFTQDEFDLFILDKADPKEWIRNACQSNVNRQEEFIKKDLLNKMIMPTDKKVKDEVKEKKIKRNEGLIEQGSGIIYE